MTELLAPAGNLEKLQIAFLYGADAVYIAGQQFGLRSAAANFSPKEIEQAIDFAHARGKKIYLTLNAFLFSGEISLLPEFIEFLDSVKIDAVICSDLGVMATVRQHSAIPIHVSTQASVLNSEHALAWKDMGVKRIVAARELSIVEVAEMKKISGLEVEMFVHGAMCMSFSGNCLISNYTAGRDSNRGGCIQNCRYRYTLKNEQNQQKEAHFMSSKDLSGIRLLPDFAANRIDSLKIEGRMKSSLYIATTVRAYASALKNLKKGAPFDSDPFEKELQKMPYRDYTEGALKSPPGKDSIYDEHDGIGTHYEMAGSIIEINESKDYFAFHTKNQLKSGMTIEFLPFQGNPIHYPLNQMKNVAGKNLSIAQPNGVILLPYCPGLSRWNVARVDKTQ